MRFSLYSVIGLFLFSGSTVMRSVMYVTTYIPVFFPGILKKYPARTETLIKFIIGIVLIFIFFNYTLIPNQLRLLPYKFFWETA